MVLMCTYPTTGPSKVVDCHELLCFGKPYETLTSRVVLLADTGTTAASVFLEQRLYYRASDLIKPPVNIHFGWIRRDAHVVVHMTFLDEKGKGVWACFLDYDFMFGDQLGTFIQTNVKYAREDRIHGMLANTRLGGPALKAQM